MDEGKEEELKVTKYKKWSQGMKRGGATELFGLGGLWAYLHLTTPLFSFGDNDQAPKP